MRPTNPTVQRSSAHSSLGSGNTKDTFVTSRNNIRDCFSGSTAPISPDSAIGRNYFSEFALRDFKQLPVNVRAFFDQYASLQISERREDLRIQRCFQTIEIELRLSFWMLRVQIVLKVKISRRILILQIRRGSRFRFQFIFSIIHLVFSL